MSKNKAPLPLSPSPSKRCGNSRENSPGTSKHRILRGGLDSGDENSSGGTSPAPFISRNFKNINEFGVLDESDNSDDDVDDGIGSRSFYGGQKSSFLDLAAKRKAANQLTAEINEKLAVLKDKIKKRETMGSRTRRIVKSVPKKKPNVKTVKKNQKIIEQEMVLASKPSVPGAKRRFFSARSPSKRPRSTLMIGNNKVQFGAVKKENKEFRMEETQTVDESLESGCEMFMSPVVNEEKSEIAVELDETCDEIQMDCSDENIFVEKATPTEENKEKMNKTDNENSRPLFPLFLRQRNNYENEIPSSVKKKSKKTGPGRFRPSKNDKMEQFVIDVGQKEVAAVECPECGMIYIPCDANDDALHTAHHNIRLKRLAFPGWKSERELRSFNDGRILLVLPSDAHYMLQKLSDVWEELNVELGELDMKRNENFKYYIFVSNDKKIVGVLASEPITKAYPLIPDKKGSVGNCETTSVRAMCGVYRLWTMATYRKQRIASRLLDCLRNNFVYAYVMSVTDVAFSSPTQDGAKFITQYTETDSFLVYK